ncbi:tyrosinase family protein [Streptomyces sp. NPDC056053]|uniref:tyrosinase family protein n=1 Tax=Streptomyces sp. NPDC056053 TaxID=3345696 RepID=UPI0035DF9C9C
MLENMPNAKGPAPFQGTPKAAEPALIPSTEVRPEDIATLSIEYRDGQPVIVVSGGKYSPAHLRIVDGSGDPLGAYSVADSLAPLDPIFFLHHGNMDR